MTSFTFNSLFKDTIYKDSHVGVSFSIWIWGNTVSISRLVSSLPSTFLLSMFLLSAISVSLVQPQSTNTKWKVPVLNLVLFGVVWWNLAVSNSVSPGKLLISTLYKAGIDCPPVSGLVVILFCHGVTVLFVFKLPIFSLIIAPKHWCRHTKKKS